MTRDAIELCVSCHSHDVTLRHGQLFDEHSTAVPLEGGFFSGSVKPDQDWPQNNPRIDAHE